MRCTLSFAFLYAKRRRFWAYTLAATSLQVLAGPSSAQPALNPDLNFNPGPPLAAHAVEGPGRWATAIAGDARGLWVGTEGEGIWQRDRGSTRWRRATVREGLASDDITALAVDGAGLAWAGHARDGLSVGSGARWQRVATGEFLFGARVFAVAVVPAGAAGAGDVWVAGSAGLAVCDAENRTWRAAATPAEMPAHQVSALWFDGAGALYVGTQSDGLWLAHAAKKFQDWRPVRAGAAMPDAAAGEGLPGNMVNAIAGDAKGVWVATTNGLAVSRDRGASWKFRRGSEWRDKLLGLARTVAAREVLVDGLLLRHDWVESLALDPRGNVLIGYRDGFEARTPDASQVLASVQNQGITRAIDAAPDGASTCLATYGAGVLQVGNTVPRPEQPQAAAPLPTFVEELPSAAQMLALAKELEQLAQSPVVAASLPDDWLTRGDWAGRYGRDWACMCGLNAPSNYYWGAGPRRSFNVKAGKMSGQDSMRYYIHKLYSADPNALEMPPVYFDSRLKGGYATDPQARRRVSEWNDNGTQYPPTSDGPNLYFAMDIPPGDWVLSLYTWNKDGRDGPNATRDYGLSLRERPQKSLDSDSSAVSHDAFEEWPELAHARLQRFWGGVYKRFWVRGPRKVTLRASRNGSPNTVLMGFFLDPTREKPAPYFFQGSPLPDAPTPLSAAFVGDSESKSAAATLWQALQSARTRSSGLWAQQSARFCAPMLAWMRQSLPEGAGAPGSKAAQQIASLYYAMGLFEPWEAALRQAGAQPPRDIELAQTWDGKSNYDSKGGEVILNYMKGRGSVPDAALAPPGAAARTAP